jgi:hypothetical protein
VGLCSSPFLWAIYIASSTVPQGFLVSPNLLIRRRKSVPPKKFASEFKPLRATGAKQSALPKKV